MARGRNRPGAPAPDGAFAGEILGSAISVEHPGLAQRRAAGTLVDESLNLLHVRVEPGHRTLRIPKTGATGTIVVAGRPLPLNGDALRVRPEDRTRRAALRGRRR